MQNKQVPDFYLLLLLYIVKLIRTVALVMMKINIMALAT